MKKFLLTAALILAVVTSLTAGTLAAYNKDVPFAADVTAKKFVFTAAGNENFSGNIRLKPGDSVWYKVDVASQSEVPVLFTVTSNLTGPLTDVVDMSIYKDQPNNGHVIAENVRTDTLEVKPEANDKNGFTYYVKVKWDEKGQDAKDVAASLMSAHLSVNVNGKNIEAVQETQA